MNTRIIFRLVLTLAVFYFFVEHWNKGIDWLQWLNGLACGVLITEWTTDLIGR